MTKTTSLVLVGGFLGAGKTTLLLKAAGMLASRGVRCAVITNDQAGDLVDTHLAAAAGFDTAEVAGGCFCCRFSDFARAAEGLLAQDPDVIFAEPVGSCIDLAATVLAPLRKFHAGQFRLAPFTVLADPERARELLAPGADPHAAYLFRNQLAEADFVCLTKLDLGLNAPDLPGGITHRLSARTGEGVAEWLADVLAEGATAKGRILAIDYAEYAEAEAALGWLNWHARVKLHRALSPAQVIGPLLDEIDAGLTRAGIAIAHLKVFGEAPTGYVRASICRNGEEPWAEGALDASPATRHEIVLNLRARGAPETMRRIVEDAAARIPGGISVLESKAFRPAPPKPEHRFENETDTA